MQFKSEYKDGDTRIVKNFAIFPKYVYNKDNSYTVIWLEWYYNNEVYKDRYWQYVSTKITKEE